MVPKYPGEVPDPSYHPAVNLAGTHVAGMLSQIRVAARLMYAGAVLGPVGSIYYGLTTRASTAPVVLFGNPRSTAFGVGFIFGAFLAAAVIASLWLWMAWAVRRGKNWARVVSTVLLGLGVVRLFGPVGVYEVTWALSWLAGLAAVILLFMRPSSAFFAARGR